VATASPDAAALPAFDVSEGASAPQDTGPLAVPHERFVVEVGDAPTRGPASAPVTVVMFSDFECPYCQRGHDTVAKVRERYGDQVRLVYKAFPLDFHSNAMNAAMAARFAQEQGKFWDYHDRLFSSGGIEAAALARYASELGLARGALEAALRDLRYGPAVRRDMRQGRKLGVRSTPSFFINGRLITGAQPYAAFAAIVEEELGLAERWVAAGVNPAAIYEHATREGFREVRVKGARGLDPDATYPVTVDDSPASGPADALVTLVEFADYECPFCARGHEVVSAMQAEFGPDLRVVFKHQPLPFHSHAFLAARAAEAAHAQGKFWRFHARLYARRAQFDEAALLEVAREAGLDMARFKRDMATTAYDARIARDMDLAARLGVNGTPAYFINGRPIEGAMPPLEFKLTILEELERARAAVAGGVERARVYEHLTLGE
jgi:protein-disulfide isomerase